MKDSPCYFLAGVEIPHIVYKAESQLKMCCCLWGVDALQVVYNRESSLIQFF